MINAFLKWGVNGESDEKFLLRFGLMEDYIGTDAKNFIDRPMLSKKRSDEYRKFST